MPSHDEIASIIVDAAFDIRWNLGPGLLESVYLEILYYEIKQHNLKVLKEVGLPIIWKSIVIDVGFRADLLIEDKVIVELKASERTLPVYSRQVLTYLKASNIQLGMLINFGDPILRNGIRRIVNNLPESEVSSKNFCVEQKSREP